MQGEIPAIQTENLTKRYGRVTAVDGLNLIVQKNEIFGFLGPNGAGKTTTMRMLLGLVSASAGSARVLGMDIKANLPTILSRTGSLIEQPTFYPYLSGFDNMRVVARIEGTSEDRIAPVLDLVDLSGAANRKYKTYSLGMKQRLAVGAALLNEPDLLILDEPANGLDPAGIADMRVLLKRLKDEGHTVFISSHVLHEIEQVCDRVVILVSGRIVVQGRVHELLSARGRIQVRIARAGEAQALLASLPWVADVQRTNDQLLVTASLDRSAELNEVLARHELFASEIRQEEQSLEQYFLDVTTAAHA